MQHAVTRVLCFLLVLTGLATPAFAKRVALVIGNSGYEHATSLVNPKNDADAIAAVLEKLGFTVLKGVDLSRLQLEKKVRDFSRVMRGADTALFYYAGHGLQVNGRNYLAPVDAKLADEADLEFETVRLETVLAQMEREPRTNLVFLDACRDNPLARNLARSMGTRSTAIGRGLARVESGIGTLVAFSTQPGNVALDGAGANSPFTAALLKHIRTPGLDVAQLLRRVRVDVIDATSNRQVPWSNSSLTGDFFFAGPGTGARPVTKEDDGRVAKLKEEVETLKKQLRDKPAPQRKDLESATGKSSKSPNIHVTRLSTQIRDKDLEAAYRSLKSRYSFLLDSKDMKTSRAGISGTGTSILYVWAKSFNSRDAKSWCKKLSFLAKFDPYPDGTGNDIDCHTYQTSLARFQTTK